MALHKYLSGAIVLLSTMTAFHFTYLAYTAEGLLLPLLWALIALSSLAFTSWHLILALTQSGSPLQDLDIQPGSCMAIIGAFTSLCLQQHHPLVAYGVKLHSNFEHRPLQRIMRTVMFAEVAVNGSVEEQEQLASWLRWMHVRVEGIMPLELVRQTGMKLDPGYSYTPQLMAYVLQTLIWSTTAFQIRYSASTSTRALDAMVIGYAMVGRNLGIPDHMMPMSYAEFRQTFATHLSTIPCADDELRPKQITRFEIGDVYAVSSWFMRAMFHSAWVLGVHLLPEEVRNGYPFACTRTRHARFLFHVLDWTLWVVYPLLPWLPLRGLLNLVCIFEPRMTAVCTETLCTIRSMNLDTDRPAYKAANRPTLVSKDDNDSFTEWLSSYRPFDPATATCSQTLMQCACIRAVEVRSSWAIFRVPYWIGLLVNDAASILGLNFEIMLKARKTAHLRRLILQGSHGKSAPIPQHIGCVMDGNRRWSRQEKSQNVHEGHKRGAGIARAVLTWWIGVALSCEANGSKTVPRTLTLWSLSADNIKRKQEEVEGLYRLHTMSMLGLRHAPFLHLFRIRIRVIGSRSAMATFPPELTEAIEKLERATSAYGIDGGGLDLQLAVGYGGQDETVDAVNALQARNAAISVDSISRETYTARNRLAPVDLVLRTSEHRTSGFLLWEAQGAELFFIDKLWPEFNEVDWLSAVRAFGMTEQRRGL